MNHIKLNKGDADILDIILKTVIENGYASSDLLPPLTKHHLSDLRTSKTSDYRYYIDLLREFNIVNIEKTIGNGFIVRSIPIVTKRFQTEGGFTGLYDRQQYEQNLSKEYEAIRLKKLKWDSKLSKWQAKTFWYVFFLGVIGGICGIVSLSLQLGEYKIKAEREVFSQQQIKNEIDTTKIK